MAPVEIGFVRNPQRPIIPFRMEVAEAQCAAPHAHPRAQLIFASRGFMRVVAENNTWLVPPFQAVWVPPRLLHQVVFPGQVSIRNLFVDPRAAAALPVRCLVFDVSPLLRELILRVSEVPERATATRRLMLVILDELRQITPAPLNLPMGSDPRLRKVMAGLIAAPDNTQTLAEWAQLAGAAARTLARLFARETGMTFGEWRARQRMLTAIEHLGQGHSVTRVALDLGYQNLSAFIAMFRKILGKTPGQYFSTRENR